MAETPETPGTTSTWPGWAKGLTLAIGGAVLGFGGCMAFLNDMNSPLGSLGSIVFVASLFVVPIGGIWFLVGLIKAITRSSTTRLTDGNSDDE